MLLVSILMVKGTGCKVQGAWSMVHTKRPRNSEHGTWNTEHGTRNLEPGTLTLYLEPCTLYLSSKIFDPVHQPFASDDFQQFIR